MLLRFLTLLLLLPFTGCSKNEVADGGTPTVLVTLPPYAFFMEQLAGETINIVTLIPPGTNLHIYEPTPKDVEEVARASVWFRIDEPFEKKLVAVFEERKPKVHMVDLQKGLSLVRSHAAIELTPTICKHDHSDRDLHTWLSPKLMLEQVVIMHATLVELFPEHQRLYQVNFETIEKELKGVDRDLREQLSPFKGDALLVSHPAFAYFCREYNLLQLSVECEGKDPKPKDVEEIIAKASDFNVRSVFLQKGFNNRGAQLIGEQLKIPVYTVDPYAKNYFMNMREIGGYIAQ